MRAVLFARFALCGALLTAGALAGAQEPPKPSQSRASAGALPFSARFLDGNRVTCSVIAYGELCSDASTILGGGAWPKSTFISYIFGSGLQIAGQIPSNAGGGKSTFAWAGDTVGALFFDVRGTQQHGDAVDLLFSSRDSNDVVAWPSRALIHDTAAFAAMYLSQPAASHHDIWGRFWDGNPVFLSGRTHPMGVLVEQRAMAWDYPEWNKDVVYFVFTITNVTARNSAVYANPTIPPGQRADIAALGARFHDTSEARFAVSIPDDGYALDNVYLALTMDPDIGNAGQNYATAVLPFGTALAYKSDFHESYFTFPPEVFGQPPLFAAPGLVGARFLRSPGSFNLFSTLGGTSVNLPPPVGVRQLWRYLSGNISPATGDSQCSVPDPKASKFCYQINTPLDIRYYLSHGPFTLPAGESRTVVLAYLFAAPVDTVRAYVGGNLVPGVPFTGDSIAADPGKIRAIERVAGWRTQVDANGNGAIEDSEVVTAPRSLLHKAQLAQALADAKFLLPQPPVAPRFFLIPGDKRVTVVWQPSVTETAGDPYFPIAADRTSPLYDPNFRRNDVEGYRIYRGTRRDRLELVAQLDYQGTQLRDYTGNLFYAGRCAPELGVLDDCPVAFPPVPDTTVFAGRDLTYQVIQVPPGGRIESTNGTIATIVADTVGGVRGVPFLNETGVRFSYVDSTVGNAFSYFYAVTAFDINSVRSGPASFESAVITQTVRPRRGSGQATAGIAPVVALLGADGTVLDPTAPLPTLNATNGNFAGPMPPTDGLVASLDAFIPEILGTDSVFIRIDSVVPDPRSSPAVGGYLAAIYHLTAQTRTGQRSLALPARIDFFSGEFTASASLPAAPLSQAQAARFGGDSTFLIPSNLEVRTSGTWRVASWGRASVNGDPSNSDQNGPRWWNGTLNENTFAPNELQCAPANGSCVQGNLSRNSGTLSGVDTLFHLHSYSTVPNTPMRELEGVLATVTRAADFRLYWGVNGAIDSVVDVTHHVRVPFSPTIGASWGILTDSSFFLAGTNQTFTADGRNDVITWSDAFCVSPAPSLIVNQCSGGLAAPARLLDRVRLAPVSARSSTYAGTSALPVTGLGFILYLNGHFFLTQTAPPLPGPGTVWNARFYSGTITGTAAAANYAFVPAVRPPAVPGLRARLAFAGSTLDLVRTNDSLLARVHTVPDPYYGASAFETSAGTQRLAFVNLPARAIIRVYSVSGILVAVLVHDDPTGGGEAYWNLRSRTGKAVASGVYFYHIETPDHRRKIGRFTVVNAFAR